VCVCVVSGAKHNIIIQVLWDNCADRMAGGRVS